MLERINSVLITPVPEYSSPLNKFDKAKIDDYETFNGSGEKIIQVLRHELKHGNPENKESSINVLYRSYELMKIAIDEKILVFDPEDDEDEKAAVKAIDLSVDLAINCFSGNYKSALVNLSLFENLVKNTKRLSYMLKYNVNEKSDPAFMPTMPGEEDLREAEELMLETKGAPILAIGLGHRGLRRGLDVFLDYRFKSQTPSSLFWPARLSFNYDDPILRLNYYEIQLLQKAVVGRKVVVIGPDERFERAEKSLIKMGIWTYDMDRIITVPLKL